MFDFKFEYMGIYKVVFQNVSTHLGFMENSFDTKPYRTEAVLYYIDEDDENINFCTGSVNNNSSKYFNIITISKKIIIEKPLRLLLQPNLDFIESNDEIRND